MTWFLRATETGGVRERGEKRSESLRRGGREKSGRQRKREFRDVGRWGDKTS